MLSPLPSLSERPTLVAQPSASTPKNPHLHPTPASQSRMQTAESGLVLLEGPCIWARLTKINTSATHARANAHAHTHKHSTGIVTHICAHAARYPHPLQMPTNTTSINTENRGNWHIPFSHPHFPPSSYPHYSRLWTKFTSSFPLFTHLPPHFKQNLQATKKTTFC